MQGIKVTSDNIISVVEIDTSDYHSIIDCIGCDIFEVVGTELLRSYFSSDVVFCMDEDACFKELPVNFLGSYFYGTIIHQHPIRGDILFLVRNGPELCGFDSASVVVDFLVADFKRLKVGDSNG